MDAAGRWWRPLAGPAAGLVMLGLAVLGTGYEYTATGPPPASDTGSEGAPALATAVPPADADERRLQRALAGMLPKGRYIVIDRTHNRLSVREGDRVLLVAVCSAGSGRTLQDVDGRREWVLDTPRGRFDVRGKISNPVWRKPDRAFVEAGESVPASDAARFEYGVLGEYALDLGDGYLIHGTLYERLLGRSVTHGCIRLGRDDLRQVYGLARIGTPVFIF